MVRQPKTTVSGSDATLAEEEARLRTLDLDIREKELALKFRERELDLRERELEFKAKNRSWAAWNNPTFVGILVAAIGLAGNAVVAQINGVLTRDLEQQRGEYARVLEMIKVGAPDQAAANLKMLLDSGLYTDRSGKLEAYLKSRKSGQGAFLPAIAELIGRRPTLDPSSIQILEKAAQTDAPWLKVALKEIDVKEVAGPGSNPRIEEYLKSTGITGPISDEIPWNSAFLNWVFQQSGVQGTNSNMGLSWETWGTKIEKPRPGAIVIFRRGEPGAWTRHAGFYVRPGKQSKTILVLGGNTSDAVQMTELNADRAVAYRWPASVPHQDQSP